MSERHSYKPSSMSGSSHLVRVNSSQTSSPAEYDEGHLYKNFAPDFAKSGGRQRTQSDVTKLKANKKPMPAPKPSSLSVAPKPDDVPRSRKSSSDSASPIPEEHIYDNAFVVQRDRVVKSEAAKKPEEVLYSEALPVTKNDTTYGIGEALYAEALPVKMTKATLKREEAVYSEPIAVSSRLLPMQERITSKGDLDPEPIYEEASVVCVSKLSAMTRSSVTPLKPAKPPDENLYEEAAVVSLLKLPPAETNGPVKVKDANKPEPIYCDAVPVVSSKLTLEERKFNHRSAPQVNCVYQEAMEVLKQPIDSSDEEEPAYFNLLLLQKSIQSQKLWNSRADPHLDDWAKLEQGTSRAGAVKVLPVPPPKKPGHNLGSVPEDTFSRPGASLQPTRYQSLDEDWSDGLIGLPTTCDEADLNKTRKWVVSNMLDSERSYCDMLELLVSHINILKEAASAGREREIIASKDIDMIFFGIQDLRNIHKDFVQKLQPVVDRWTKDSQIGEPIKEMAVQEYSIADEYLKRHNEAVATIQRCWTENARFAQLTKTMKCGHLDTNLEELLRKPIERFQRNVLVLHDLKKYTPTSHPDYDLVMKTLRIAKNFLDVCTGSSNSSAEDNRYLVKQGITVEKPDKVRKMRQLFLFNDVIVCCKQKISAAKQAVVWHPRWTYEVKWFIPLQDLNVDDKFSAQEEKQASFLHQKELSDLKKELIRLKGDLKAEMKKLKTVEGQTALGPRQNRNIDSIRKKLAEQEAALLVASPHLQLKLSNRANKKSFVLLMASDYERTNWKSTISGLIGKVNQMPAKLSLADIVNLINSQKIPKQLDNDDVSLEEEHLTGSLTVTIHELHGLKQEADAFCSIEVDSFGHFFSIAKTNRAKGLEPSWNEDFDIDLEGAQSMHILCYKIGQQTDSLLGKCSLALQKEWLVEDFQNKGVSLTSELLLTVSLKYTSAENLKRSSSSLKSGVFGVQLERIAKKEGKAIPIIVTACIEEIEKRGLKDVGIYRISGLSAEIQRLKKAFNKNSIQGSSGLADVDTNVMTSLVKLFFRELPEALFTDSRYPEFVKGIGLSDPDTKKKFLMGQLCSLPPCNYDTVIFILGHLVRVAKNAEINKMSLSNLATVFGPTLLRPAEKDQNATGVGSLFCHGANEVFMQSTILLYFLNLKANDDFFPPPSKTAK